MKILTTIKRVPDLELDLSIHSGIPLYETNHFIINAWDENAIEAAVQLKEENQAQTTVININHEDTTDIIRKALSMGIDEGILIRDSSLENVDYTKLAIILKKVFQADEYDLVIMGKQAQDSDNGSLGIMLAELSNIPYVCNVIKIEVLTEKRLKVSRVSDSGTEIIELELPALLTVNETINEPRIPSLRGVMTAKRKKIKELNLSELQVEALINTPDKTQTLEFIPVTSNKKGQKFEGEVEEITSRVVRLLKDETTAFKV